MILYRTFLHLVIQPILDAGLTDRYSCQEHPTDTVHYK